MSRYLSGKYANLTPYTPGEQPQNRKYIKLNTNESPFPPSPRAIEYANAESKKLNLYSDPACKTLVSAAAKHYGISEDEIIFTNGSDDILNFAFMAFCDGRHGAAFPNITYGFYKVFAELNGVPHTVIPLNADLTVPVEALCGVNKTVFLANPNAPTGIALPLSEVERIIKSNPDSVVVVDEAYVDFGGESAISLIHTYDNLLVTRTFSKSRSLAGGRLGYGIACKELIADLNAIRFSTNPYNINRMTMAAGVGAIEDDGYFKSCVSEIIATREDTKKSLRGMGFAVTDSAANFLFARHATVSGDTIYRKLKDNGILVRHFSDPLITDYNRISIGSRQDMACFLQKLSEILEESK